MIDVPATARYATPVFIAEYPSTCCMYSVSIRNIEKSAVPRMKPATFAPSTVFVRRIPKRISGSLTRFSQSTKPTRSAAATAKTPIVRAELQPQLWPWVIASDERRQTRS